MLEEKIKAILAFQATGSDRIDKWKYKAQYGELFNIAEDIPEYRDWNDGFEALKHGCSTEADGTSYLPLLPSGVLSSLVCIERAFYHNMV